MLPRTSENSTDNQGNDCSAAMGKVNSAIWLPIQQRHTDGRIQTRQKKHCKATFHLIDSNY